MNIGLWAQVAVLIIDCYIGLFGTGFIQVLYLGRAPRTKETLLDFHEKCRVARHSRVFRGLTGSQPTPGFWGVTLHVMDENVTHPSPHLEPSLTPSRIPKLSVRNTDFKTKGFYS